MKPLGLGYGVNKLGAKASLPPVTENEPEVDAYIAGQILSQTSIDKLNVFVSSLKTGWGVETLAEKQDVIYVFRGQNEVITLRNLVKNAHHADALNNPIFTQFEGWTGVVENNANIRTNYNPATDGVTLQQTNASFWAYHTTDRAQSFNKSFGIFTSNENDMYITPYGTRFRVFSTFHLSVSGITTALGFRAGIRDNASQQKGVVGKTISTENRPIQSIPSKNFRFLALAHIDDGSNFDVLQPDDIQIAFGGLGAAFSQSDVNVLVDAIEAYIATPDDEGESLSSLNYDSDLNYQTLL